MFYQHDHRSYRCHRGGTRWDFTLVGNKVRMVKWEKSVRKAATSGDKRNFSRYLRGRQLLYRGDIGVTRWMSRQQFASWCCRTFVNVPVFLDDIDAIIPHSGEIINLTNRGVGELENLIQMVNQEMASIGLAPIDRYIVCHTNKYAGWYGWDQTGRRFVTIGSRYLVDDISLRHLLYHEIGHHIHYSVCFNMERPKSYAMSADMIANKYQEIRDIDRWFPSGYSRENVYEWWAEIYSHYMIGWQMDDDVKNFVHSLLVSLRDK